MMKKRLIFSLLYNDGFFVQSRNFRLQKVGDVNWLLNNYRFEKVAEAIDELVIISVSRSRVLSDDFYKVTKELGKKCFMPKMFGGAITNIDDAKRLFDSGADKVILSSALFTHKSDVQTIVKNYGSQAVVGCLDCKWNEISKQYDVFIKNSSEKLAMPFQDAVAACLEAGVGEVMLQSIGQDGTGNGLDLNLVDHFQQCIGGKKIPLILAGGAGNFEHIRSPLERDGVSAVLTANLLNFMGDSLKQTRTELIKLGLNLPRFSSDEFKL